MHICPHALRFIGMILTNNIIVVITTRSFIGKCAPIRAVCCCKNVLAQPDQVSQYLAVQ